MLLASTIHSVRLAFISQSNLYLTDGSFGHQQPNTEFPLTNALLIMMHRKLKSGCHYEGSSVSLPLSTIRSGN